MYSRSTQNWSTKKNRFVVYLSHDRRKALQETILGSCPSNAELSTMIPAQVGSERCVKNPIYAYKSRYLHIRDPRTDGCATKQCTVIWYCILMTFLLGSRWNVLYASRFKILMRTKIPKVASYKPSWFNFWDLSSM